MLEGRSSASMTGVGIFEGAPFTTVSGTKLVDVHNGECLTDTGVYPGEVRVFIRRASARL